ncbi:MAG: hypothetical protein LKG17_07575 [Megasphaera sp.]|jgi:hypothetical protein|nr:hypothetical protein [Megasphaera sp.]
MDSDEKMVETAMRTAFIRQHGIELPEWINDHKRPCTPPAVTGDAEPITLWDMAKVALKVMAAAFIIGLIGAAWQ